MMEYKSFLMTNLMEVRYKFHIQYLIIVFMPAIQFRTILTSTHLRLIKAMYAFHYYQLKIHSIDYKLLGCFVIDI